jgi:hypothetical protein
MDDLMGDRQEYCTNMAPKPTKIGVEIWEVSMPYLWRQIILD